MIKFIQDYTTKALPPETFKLDQEVKRSAESEAYLVRLGVAGYVHDGVLVDQDYKPIVLRTEVVEVVSGDRRFADGGRGGEVIGVTAPQRASTGPGNAVMFGADNGLSAVQVDQLSADMSGSMPHAVDVDAADAADADRTSEAATSKAAKALK